MPNLFATDEKADIMEMVRPAMMAATEDKNADFTPLAMFTFFVNKCKENLHIVIAFSPIGDAFRNRLVLRFCGRRLTFELCSPDYERTTWSPILMFKVIARTQSQRR